MESCFSGTSNALQGLARGFAVAAMEVPHLLPAYSLAEW